MLNLNWKKMKTKENINQIEQKAIREFLLWALVLLSSLVIAIVIVVYYVRLGFVYIEPNPGYRVLVSVMPGKFLVMFIVDSCILAISIVYVAFLFVLGKRANTLKYDLEIAEVTAKFTEISNKDKDKLEKKIQLLRSKINWYEAEAVSKRTILDVILKKWL